MQAKCYIVSEKHASALMGISPSFEDACRLTPNALLVYPPGKSVGNEIKILYEIFTSLGSKLTSGQKELSVGYNQRSAANGSLIQGEGARLRKQSNTVDFLDTALFWFGEFMHFHP